jgi:3' terminal RNA ribose 2'-O-methyltransferase Hen1
MNRKPGRRDRRLAAAMKEERPDDALYAPIPERDVASTALHAERLEAVVALLLASGARRVLDLGCGSGQLLERLLVEDQFTEVIGLDSSILALQQAELLLQVNLDTGGGRLSLVHGSFTDPGAGLRGFDAAAMVETVEHLAPDRLASLERVVFGDWSPPLVLVTTPNQEYNVRLGIAEGAYRHPDHRFEWSRARFRAWAGGVATRNGYEMECREVGPRDPLLGSPTQMAVFRRHRPSDDQSAS